MQAATRSFRDLSTTEARDLLRGYAVGLVARRDRFRTHLEALGGPVEAVDLGGEGIDAIGRWLAETMHLPSVPIELEDLDRWPQGPWWLDLQRETARYLGYEVSLAADGLAAAMGIIATDRRPDASWILDKRRGSAFRNHPYLDIPGIGRWDIDCDIVATLSLTLRGDQTWTRRLQHLSGEIDKWTTQAPAAEAPGDGQLPDAVVDVVEAGRFTHEVSLSDELAARPRAVKALVAALLATPGVREVHHEDRELLLVAAPGIDAVDLQAAVKDAMGEGAT